MRFIVKNTTDLGYRPLIGKKIPNSASAATTAWKKFNGKPSVINALLAEQYNLCCYSELRSDENDLGYHIEHIANKSIHPARTFCQSNLAASAIKDEKSTEIPRENIFGGHATGKKAGVDILKFISCRQANCRSNFLYTADGMVYPSAPEGRAAYTNTKYTIDLLNLNSPYLISLRKEWYKKIQDDFDECEDRGMGHMESAEHYLVPRDKKLHSFFSMTRQIFGRWAESALQKKAPHLL